MAIDKPNLVLPLAASYNPRGVASYTNTFTNGIDQRKINSIYELVKNSATGSGTMYLTKRPGAVNDGNTYGTSGQVAYLAQLVPSSGGNAAVWVFSTSGDDIRASSSSTTTVITTAAGYVPTYTGMTSISGTDTVVVQLRNAALAQKVFFSSAIGSFTEITDSDFTGLTLRGNMEFMDGYAFVLSDNNRIYNSNINTLADWDPTSYITKQIKQDVPTGIARFGKQIIAFGEETFEVFSNIGNPTGSPLSTNQQLARDYGMARLENLGVGKSHAVVNGVLFFIGRSSGGARNVGLFAYNGSAVERVSNNSVDKIINSLQFGPTTNVFSVDRISFYGQEAVALSIDPVTSSTQRWLMFFPKFNEWFEWNSTVFIPRGTGTRMLGVGSNQHKVYMMYSLTSPSSNYQDDGVDYTWVHQFQLPDNGNQRKFMPYMALKGDTARSAQNISVEFSDDDYQTFSTARTIDMTGKQKALFRCGSYQGARVVKLSHTGNTEVRLSQFLARIE